MTDLKVYNFMGLRKIAAIFSALCYCVYSVALCPPKVWCWGLDFSGGTQIEVGYEQPADVGALRQQLEAAGFEGPVVIHYGSETDVLIRLQGQPEQGLSEQCLRLFSKTVAKQLSCVGSILLGRRLVKNCVKMAVSACSRLWP